MAVEHYDLDNLADQLDFHVNLEPKDLWFGLGQDNKLFFVGYQDIQISLDKEECRDFIDGLERLYKKMEG